MEVVLLRHGEALGNPEHRFVGITDAPLTQKGEEQAIRRSSLIPRVECVFTSPLRRCVRTADIVWPDSRQIVVEDLRETNFGRFENKRHEELENDPEYQVWLNSGGEAGIAGTETLDTCILRIQSALIEILKICSQNSFKSIGVVTHGGTITNMLWKFGKPKREYYDWLSPNCGGWIVEITESPIELNMICALEQI